MVQTISRMKLILMLDRQITTISAAAWFVVCVEPKTPATNQHLILWLSNTGAYVDVKHPADLAMTLNSQVSFSRIAPGALCLFSTSQSESNLESPPNKKNFTFWQKNKQQGCLPHLYFFFSSFFSDVSPLSVKPIQSQCRWSLSRAHKHTLSQSKCQCYGTWKESASLPNLTAFIIY